METNFFKNIFNKDPDTKPSPEEIESLTPNHLIEGVHPLRAITVDEKNIDSETKAAIDDIQQNGEYVSWSFFEKDFDRNNIKNFRHHGSGSYVISEANEKNKYSKKYKNCTGVALVGASKETGEDISILSHQYPYSLYDSELKNVDSPRALKQDLEESLKEFKEKCLEGTIDVTMFGGGNYIASGKKEYTDSIKSISEVCKNILGFEPVILSGPNLITYPEKVYSKPLNEVDEINNTDIYLDTKNRRLYIVRPGQEYNIANHPYVPSLLEKKSKKWKSKEVKPE